MAMVAVRLKGGIQCWYQFTETDGSTTCRSQHPPVSILSLDRTHRQNYVYIRIGDSGCSPVFGISDRGKDIRLYLPTVEKAGWSGADRDGDATGSVEYCGGTDKMIWSRRTWADHETVT